MFSNSHILIAGSGFVGTNLARKLAKMDSVVTATYFTKFPQWPVDGVNYVQCDLTKKDQCDAIVKNIDYIFMCAAKTSGAAILESDPLSMFAPNVLMNVSLLDSAYHANVKKFLFVSSSTVYPVVDHQVREDDANYSFFRKYHVDGWVNSFSEVACKMYSDTVNYPMKTIIIRPANLYGPYDNFDIDKSHVIPSLIRKVVERDRPIEVWGDGYDIKGFVFIDDFIEALILAINKVDYPEPINIAESEPYTIKQILDTILEIDNYKDAKIVFNHSMPTMIKKRVMDSTKARMQLDFSPSTSIRNGIKKTICWYRDNYKRK